MVVGEKGVVSGADFRNWALAGKPLTGFSALYSVDTNAFAFLFFLDLGHFTPHSTPS